MGSLSRRLEDLITPALEEKGLGLVRVLFSRGKKGVLQIMVERLDDGIVTMEDCVTASREISVLLDVEDPIDGSYNLEVTSPGLDRPLVKPEHFTRFGGALVNVQTFAPFEGQKKFKGLLLSSDEESFTIEEDKGEEKRGLTFSYEEVSKVSLVPSFEA